MLHSAFKYLKNEKKLDSLFNYEKGTSLLIQYLKSLNNIELMNSWLIQCCVNEAFQLVNSLKLNQEEYQKKIEKKSELEKKENLLKVEKKELKRLQKLKEPKIIFGR